MRLSELRKAFGQLWQAHWQQRQPQEAAAGGPERVMCEAYMRLRRAIDVNVT